jgi:hypothetical protein
MSNRRDSRATPIAFVNQVDKVPGNFRSYAECAHLLILAIGNAAVENCLNNRGQTWINLLSSIWLRFCTEVDIPINGFRYMHRNGMSRESDFDITEHHTNRR